MDQPHIFFEWGVSSTGVELDCGRNTPQRDQDKPQRSQNTEFDGIITADKAIRQGHADATDPSNVLTIDCSLSNYFEITHSSNALTAVEFENASEGQRIILQLKNGYYSGSMSSFWDDITINDDSDGDVIWAGGTEPSSAAGTTDLYGFVFSGDVKVAYGYIIGQDFKA